MPRIGSNYVHAEDFIINSDEIDELIESLKDYGYISENTINHSMIRAESERIFEKKLNNLHGKWNLISKKDEAKIIRISESV